MITQRRTIVDKSELPFLIAQALRLLNDPRILGITPDGGEHSEVMIDTTDESGKPVTFIIRSRDIDEEPTENQ
jgi:hypothetical protein